LKGTLLCPLIHYTAINKIVTISIRRIIENKRPHNCDIYVFQNFGIYMYDADINTLALIYLLTAIPKNRINRNCFEGVKR
jgi:hypothetical protein